MYPDAGITGSVQSLARNGRLTYASITGVGVLILALATRHLHHLVNDPAVLAAYHQRQDRSVSWWRPAPPALSGASRAGLSASSAAPPGTVYHSGYLPDGNGR
jgi:hypothetical protein